MRELESVSCPNCLEFLGNIDKLDECPICGYALKNEKCLQDTQNDNYEEV